MANDAEITETTEAEVADTGALSAQSVINEAITALNTLSERLTDLEEKGGDAPGFSNSAPDSSERVEGAGADAPEVVADLSHGGTLTPEQMAVEGSPAGGDTPAPTKAPKAAAAEPAEAEKSEEVVEETVVDDAEEAKVDGLDGLNLSELREFHDLITYADLGE